MFRKTVAKRNRCGQVMVESILTMIVILLIFLAVFNLSDQIRAKLFVENAAVKCARARAVGYNDFMLTKIARLSTMPAAGKCLTLDTNDKDALSLDARYSKIDDYLMSEYEAQADAILDFEYWQNGDTYIQATSGNTPAAATVTQRRPDDFGFDVFVKKKCQTCEDKVDISATATVEAHYPDYLQ